MTRCRYESLEETLYREVLPGGLTVLVVPKPGFTRKTAYFATDFGAIHTAATLDGVPLTIPAGTAHYLEHKLFDLSGRDVSAEFAAMGANVNAFTSYDMTAYYFSGTDRFDECLRLLLEFVSTPYFTAESVEKERGIIAQEIGMNDDSPETRVFENLMKIMYAAHPISVPILGTRDTIAQITDEVLYRCHRAFYSPQNMVLCVVGDVDPEAVVDTARAMLPEAPGPKVRRVRRWDEPMSCPSHETQDRMEVAMPTFQAGFKCEPPQTGEAGIRQEFIGDLAAEALFGESSALYLRLYEEGLIDSSFGGGFETVEGMAMLTCSGDSDDPRAVVRAVLDEARRLTREGIDPEAFRRMKRSALGRRIRNLDSLDSTCFRLCTYHFTGFDYFCFPQVFEAVRETDLLEFLARVATGERCGLSTIFPTA